MTSKISIHHITTRFARRWDNHTNEHFPDDTKGRCSRCGKKSNELGDGLCLRCWDKTTSAAERIDECGSLVRYNIDLSNKECPVCKIKNSVSEIRIGNSIKYKCKVCKTIMLGKNLQ